MVDNKLYLVRTSFNGVKKQSRLEVLQILLPKYVKSENLIKQMEESAKNKFTVGAKLG